MFLRADRVTLAARGAVATRPGPRNSTERTTTVAVQIKRQSDGTQIWEGRASKTATAGSQGATLTWAVPVLSEALFRDFPGTPGANDGRVVT